jgi:hypothetical protein
MQLRVFEDDTGELHLEISSPGLVYGRRLFVPMLPSIVPALAGVDERTLVGFRFQDIEYKAPYLLIHSEDTAEHKWKMIGKIDENDSRNVLNHILDILAWD